MSNPRTQPHHDGAWNTEGMAPAARFAERAEPQPFLPTAPHDFMSELQDALDRDRQFLIRTEELLAQWKGIVRRMQRRLRDLLADESSSCQRGWD
jgi:hypothetical protein